jgi:hypothetical protein
MDKKLASEIIDTILAAEKGLGALDSLSERIADDQERKVFRRNLAEIMVRYTDLIVAIAHQYPELDPDKPILGNG